MSLSDNANKITAILAAANALPEALDTSDATAAAKDIVKDKTAYVNGEKVTGTLERARQITGNMTSKEILYPRAMFSGKTSKAFAIEANKDITLTMPAVDLGNAADADVAKGKTYTSASGFKRTGTHEEAAAPSGSINITENGTYDVTDKASAVVSVPSTAASPCVIDLGAVGFTAEFNKTAGVVGSDGELTGETVAYTEFTSGGFTAPDEWYSDTIYGTVIPFKIMPFDGQTESLAVIDVRTFYNYNSGNTTYYGEMSVGMGANGSNMYLIGGYTDYFNESKNAFFENAPLALMDTTTSVVDGTAYWHIVLLIRDDMLSDITPLANNAGSSGNTHLTDELDNAHILLIKYPEEETT